jgi:hypothetical protein
VAAFCFTAHTSNHVPQAIKKNEQSWRAFAVLRALAHEPAQITKAGKNKTETKP